MSALAPLALRLEGSRLSCVVDLRLALSRWGLMLAWRLSEELDIWLYRGFWALLDDSKRCLSDPEELWGGPAGGLGAPLDRAVAAEALHRWEQARSKENLPSFPFYYAGDCRHESSLPKDTGMDLVRRFEVLAGALRGRGQWRDVEGSAEDCAQADFFRRSYHQLDCWRDAAALHVALAHRRPLTLTLSEAGGQAPALCQYLARAGLECRRVSWSADAHPMRDFLEPMLIRTAAAELIWAGLPLAVVHIVAPAAFAIPSPGESGGELCSPGLDPLGSDERFQCVDPWRDAVCLWYSLA